MTTILENPQCKWMEQTRKILYKYEVQETDLKDTKEVAKQQITLGIHRKMVENMNASSEGRSKMKFFMDNKAPWIPEKPADYMRMMTRKQVSIIFKARTRMTRINGNYKNEFPDQTCRACKSNPETHMHALNECITLNPLANASTDNLDMFSENIEILKNEANKIELICNKLKEL